MSQQKTGWSIAGLFMVLLVLTLPIYSANVLAVSVQITRNSGEDSFNGYLDAQGDIWTVEANILDLPANTEEAVAAENVRLVIGSNDDSFDSCSETPLGASCRYTSPLNDGVAEGVYEFDVVFHYQTPAGVPQTAVAADVIRADGSAPGVTIQSASQNEDGNIELDFSVAEQSPAIGINAIEIRNAQTGEVVQSISLPSQGLNSFNFRDDGSTEGIISSGFSGEGRFRIAVRAEDWLGHRSREVVREFSGDFVVPLISSNLNFTALGRFIGDVIVVSDMTVDIIETNFRQVTASSPNLNFLNGETLTDCAADPEQEALWHCTWENVEVSPAGSFPVRITAEDEFGNTAERTLTAQFVPDSAAPQIVFFGSERIFEDRSFVRDREQRIILELQDIGSGIREEAIRVNLRSLGQSETATAVGRCTEAEGLVRCVWDTTGRLQGAVSANIAVASVEDRVGNRGEAREITLTVDNDGPDVQRLEIAGLSAGGEHNYFQSNDHLKVKMRVLENNAGLVIGLNLNDIIMDAENIFPADENDPYRRNLGSNFGEGWQVFLAEEYCTRGEAGLWNCEFETPPIKSGPERALDLEISVQDTAGNEAETWPSQELVRNARSFRGARSGTATYTFDLLGLSVEDNPDYWEVEAVRSLIGFVDLDTVELAYTRIPISIELDSDNPQAFALGFDAIDCQPTGNTPAPAISRVLLHGASFPAGIRDPAATTMILEFEPFNGRELFAVEEQGQVNEGSAEYLCRLRVFSRVNEDALAAAEIQEVTVNVPFAFSTLGALDENIADRIRDLRGVWWMKLADTLRYLNTALQIIQYIADIFRVIIFAAELLDLTSETFVKSADAAEATGFFSSAGVALRGGCMALQTGQYTSYGWINTVQGWIQILNCNPGALGADSFYGRWQRSILDAYNHASGRRLLAVPATSLYENMYTSALGLCLPGIIYNLNKLREVQCRKIICYGREVPQGIATIEGCNQLSDLLMCEWVWGPFYDFFLFGGIAYLGNLLKNAFTSPLGLIKLAEIGGCTPVCLFKNPTTSISVCKFVTGINRVVGIIDAIAGAFLQAPHLTQTPYCDAADDIDLDELVGQPQASGGSGTSTAAGVQAGGQAEVSYQ